MKKSKEKQNAQKEQNIQTQIDREILVRTSSHNLKMLFESKPGSKAAIARACCITPANVSRWIAEKDTILPQAEYLVCIAEYFHVTVDWILTDHEDLDNLKRIRTYSDAFLALLPLLQYGIIDNEKIENPVLKYLCNRYISFDAGSIPKDQIAKWLQYILQEYNIPLSYTPDKEVCAYILKNQENIKAINDDETYRNLALALSNDELVLDAIEEIAYEKMLLKYDNEHGEKSPWDYPDYQPEEPEPDEILTDISIYDGDITNEDAAKKDTTNKNTTD